MAQRDAAPSPPQIVQTGPSIGVGALVAVGVASTVASSVVMFGMLLLLIQFGGLTPGPGPNPGPIDIDPAFVKLGEAYAPELIETYAASWRTMADRVDAGRPIGEAVNAFSTDWTNRRNELFDSQLAGPFKALIPEGAKEEDITSAQRAAYAAAARGVAEGLSK